MAKTGYSRAERVADQIRMEVADILLRKMRDPRVRSVTVTDVELTNDLRIARVFVTALGARRRQRMSLRDSARPAVLSEASWGAG